VYHAVVRRALAIALLGLFSFSLIPPSAFASDPDAGLPTCCRRAGKHHCTMLSAGEASSSVPVLQASRCSFFPGANLATVSSRAGVPVATLASRASNPSSPANLQANDTPHLVLFHSPRQQRGPPALFLA
jgi:hypothetical protein